MRKDFDVNGGMSPSLSDGKKWAPKSMLLRGNPRKRPTVTPNLQRNLNKKSSDVM